MLTTRRGATRSLAILVFSLLGCRPPASGGSTTGPVGSPAPAPTPIVAAVAGIFDGCPPEGSARSERIRRLNELKNRSAAPGDSDIDPSVTLAALLAPGDDRTRWDESKAAEVTGYVIRVKSGGRETTNCEAADPPDEDTHIELVLSPGDTAATRRVIVEVTPRWRAAMQAQGVDWSTNGLKAAIEGRSVKVRGWLFFDVEHRGQAANTAPGNPNDWRATAWEVHPIAGIQAVPAP